MDRDVTWHELTYSGCFPKPPRGTPAKMPKALSDADMAFAREYGPEILQRALAGGPPYNRQQRRAAERWIKKQTMQLGDGQEE